MKEIIVASWDDVHKREDSTKVTATVTVHLGLDGKWYELDLTADHNAEMHADLKRWLDAAHKPDSNMTEPYRPQPAGSPRTISRDSLRYLRELREFASRYGLNYRTETGKYYYSVALRNAFDASSNGAPESEWRAIYEAKPVRGRRGKEA